MGRTGCGQGAQALAGVSAKVLPVPLNKDKTCVRLQWVRMNRALGVVWMCGAALGAVEGAQVLAAVHAHHLPAMSEDR